ncbi:MAG: translation initiation factor IF-2 [Rickettsiales bacterium]|jgi:translation initiation factor IF-2|nr:translation initiation factor IF-2 [Rickettsiales bacterium]
MAEKLTLKLGPRAPSSTRAGGIEVEVIKKRRLPGDASPAGEAGSPEPSPMLASAKADKLKSILENAKKFEISREAEAKQSQKTELERQALIESERAKELDAKRSPESEAQDNNSPRKGRDAYDDDAKRGKSAFEAESAKRKKLSSDYSGRKTGFAGVSADDLEAEESASGAPSNSLSSAMDYIGAHSHRRSYASIKRQREKNWRKWNDKQAPKEPQKITHEVVLPETISVKELANRMAEKSSDVIKAMMKLGIMATINQIIDADTAELVVMELGHTARRVAESDVETSILMENKGEERLEARAPVVTVMGHVDHGKTSLLDALRQTDVASGEAGGITQHIGAYQITAKSGRKITFIDTPGHEAFSAMRARGAKITDIVVLVVAANDGIMPQTVEAINHAKAANVPMIVAINKIDLPDANPEKVRMDLLQQGVVVEKMGGGVLDVEISAKQKTNLDRLEEMLLLQADMLELKGNVSGPAIGAVIEAKVEQGRGSTATVLVEGGVLKKGDIFVSGSSTGRVRELLDEYGGKVAEAAPSQPVVVLGFEGTPVAGDDFAVVESEAKAHEVANYRLRKEKERQMVKTKSSWQELFAGIKEGRAETLPVIIKADTQGSAGAIADSLLKIPSEKVKVKVMHSGVGGINESDVTLAKTTGSVILAFNVRANANALAQAKRDDVDIRYYSIIYNIIDDVKVLMSGLLAPTLKEVFVGYADVIQVFAVGKIKAAGCRVTEGVIKKGSGVRLLRDDVVIFEGRLAQLKRQKDDVKEARAGVECGVSFDNWNDIAVGDRLECFDTEEVKASL